MAKRGAHRALAGAALAIVLAGGAGLARSQAPDAQAAPGGLTVDRVVLLMRHGVRPPTKSPAMPAGIAAQDWPSWSVTPGWLTAHGGVAIERLGAWDGARFRDLGLLPARGCPSEGAVRVIADSDQRTIATADHWLAALAPGCKIPNSHKPQDAQDPIFAAIETGLGTFDPAEANKAIAAMTGAGGIAAVEASQRPLLARLDAILCGTAKNDCGVGHIASGITPATAGKRPKLSGGLDRASTAAQILLLEYGDGKPLAEVGWGRATARDVTALSAFHALEFRLLARPVPLARANLAGIVPLIRDGLGDGAARVTMISGHDTNVANLGGLLNIHWQAPGLAADDPAPGGAVVIERVRDAKGNLYVRARYRAQSLDQIRSAAPLDARAAYNPILPIPGCVAMGIKGLCTMAEFDQLLAGK